MNSLVQTIRELEKTAHTVLKLLEQTWQKQCLSQTHETSPRPALFLSQLSIKHHPSKNQLIVTLPCNNLKLDQKSWLEQSFFSHPLLTQSLQHLDDSLKVRLNFTKMAISKEDSSSSSPPPSSMFDHPSKQLAHKSQNNPRTLDKIGSIYCVASGKGGVGKSTVTTDLALLLAEQNLKVGLLDGDIHGPSQPHLLNVQKATLQTNEHQKVLPVMAEGIQCVSFGFLSDSYHPAMWRGPLISKALEQFLFDVEWGTLDYLLIDLPPGTGDIPMTMAESLAVDGCLVVTTAHPIALIDAHKAVSMFQKLAVPILGVVGNMIYHRCGNCGTQNPLFGSRESLRALCEKRQIDLLSELPLIPHSHHADSLPNERLCHPEYKKALTEVCASLRNPSQEHLHYPSNRSQSGHFVTS